MKKIIANKPVELTEDEYRLYEEICASHNPGGKELFQGLFETDEEGYIVCLIPPTKRFSLQIVIFLQNLMVQQHLRRIYREHDSAMKEIHSILKEFKNGLGSSQG